VEHAYDDKIFLEKECLPMPLATEKQVAQIDIHKTGTDRFQRVV
jgi:hypothetical protein